MTTWIKFNDCLVDIQKTPFLIKNLLDHNSKSDPYPVDINYLSFDTEEKCHTYEFLKAPINMKFGLVIENIKEFDFLIDVQKDEFIKSKYEHIYNFIRLFIKFDFRNLMKFFIYIVEENKENYYDDFLEYLTRDFEFSFSDVAEEAPYLYLMEDLGIEHMPEDDFVYDELFRYNLLDPEMLIRGIIHSNGVGYKPNKEKIKAALKILKILKRFISLKSYKKNKEILKKLLERF